MFLGTLMVLSFLSLKVKLLLLFALKNKNCGQLLISVTRPLYLLILWVKDFMNVGEIKLRSPFWCLKSYTNHTKVKKFINSSLPAGSINETEKQTSFFISLLNPSRRKRSSMDVAPVDAASVGF